MHPSIAGIAPAAARKGAGGEEGEGDARARVIFQTVGGEGAVTCSAARFSRRTKFGAWDSAEPLPLENI